MPFLSARIRDIEDPNRRLTVEMYPPPKDKLGWIKHPYKYRILGAPKQHDPVLRVITLTIKELSKADLCVAAADIQVFNMTNSPVLLPPTTATTMLPVKLYAFTEYYKEFPITLPVMIRPGTKHLSADSIQVYSPNGLQLLTAFLKDLPDRKFLMSRPLSSQQDWWSRNELKFRLMDLPVELRRVLFVHILGTDIFPLRIPYEITHKQLGLGVGEPVGRFLWCPIFYEQREERFQYSGPNYRIFCVKKQVRQEALEAGWQATRKVFGDTYDFALSFDTTTGSHLQFNWLARCCLRFEMGGYMNFLGLDTYPTMTVTPGNGLGHILQRVDTLKKLQLAFESPYSESAGIFIWASEMLGDLPRRFACQKVLVDWIMTFMFPYIKHIPSVELLGYVKTSTKQDWKYILEREYAHHEDINWTGGYDNEQKVLEILQTPWMGVPPECFCPLSCDQDKVTGVEFDADDVYEGPSSDAEDTTASLPDLSDLSI